MFGDPKQNIYHREIDSQGNILLGVIPGLWNKDLIKSHRFSNPSLANLAMEFQRHFIGNSDDIESPPIRKLLFGGHLRVWLIIRTQEKTGPGGQMPLENCSGYKKR